MKLTTMDEHIFSVSTSINDGNIYFFGAIKSETLTKTLVWWNIIKMEKLGNLCQIAENLVILL